MTRGSSRPVVGVGVVLVSERKLLLIKRGREPGKGLWAVPGGKVDHGETLAEAARREVKEETGLDVEIGEVMWVGESISDHHHLVLIDFRGTVISGDLSPADDAADARWVSLSEMSQYPLTPTMYDLISTLSDHE